jgi:hypothetical protein
MSDSSFIDFDESVLSEHITAETIQQACGSWWKPSAFDNTVSLDIQNHPTVFCKTEFGVLEFFQIMHNNPTVFCNVATHNSDICIDQQLASLRPPNVVRWFAANSTHRDDRIIPLPLGLANEYKSVPNPPSIVNAKIHDIIKTDTKRIREKLLYINFRNNTYSSERTPLMNDFVKLQKLGHSWFTISDLCDRGESDRVPSVEENKQIIQTYLQEMTDHKFVLCPRGNGVDTHRLWEALYSRTIPVTRYEDAYREFVDLPILFVNDWSEVTEEFLNEKYTEMKSKTWNYSKLKITWWKKRFGEIA